MFKWVCLALASVFLLVVLWMLNDVRLEVRRHGQAVSEHLPDIVAKTRQTTDLVAERLPTLVEKTEKTADTLAELAEDVQQIKELAGVSNTARDKNLVAYANSVMETLEASNASVGVTKTLGSGLKNLQPAKEWVVAARKEALLLTLLATSKQELVRRLATTKFGGSWMLQFDGMEPVPMLDWLKANHPQTKELMF